MRRRAANSSLLKPNPSHSNSNTDTDISKHNLKGVDSSRHLSNESNPIQAGSPSAKDAMDRL